MYFMDSAFNSMHRMRIGIIGGGPSALFLLKSMLDKYPADIDIDIFEKSDRLGAGMPYSAAGALREHITNISGNEIPDLPQSLSDWVKSRPEEFLQPYSIDKETFSSLHPVPRLLFGHYLSDQFLRLTTEAVHRGINLKLHCNKKITDISCPNGQGYVRLWDSDQVSYDFDRVIIASGHIWPKKSENMIPGYFDSPYPPYKIALKADHPVAVKGASLTAIDAVRTIARANGTFKHGADGKLGYRRLETSPNFKIVLHAIGGLLPAVRVHLEDPKLGQGKALSDKDILEIRNQNDGFIPLDIIYYKEFLEPLKERNYAFYKSIVHLSIEEFVSRMMDQREDMDPFELLQAELAQAELTFERKETIHWKEMLAILSFSMNYPAKYLSAEDMWRLKKVLMPLISTIIAFVPQSSAFELLALWEAGALELKDVNESSSVEPDVTGGAFYHYDSDDVVHYKLFVDCTGQPAMPYDAFPFKTLMSEGVVSKARLAFKKLENAASEQDNENIEFLQGRAYLTVPGIAINDNFQVLDVFNQYNKRLYIMAVPYIGGYNPDYSGLDFCEEAASRIANSLING